MSKAWIGTSGWSYGHWEGVLYPAGLEPRARFELYARQFETVEVNSSYYRWTRPETMASWRRRAPDGFVFCAKAPRGLTHRRRLYQPEPWYPRLRASWGQLKERSALLLYQLSPLFPYDRARLEYFLRTMPADIRSAFEFRHPSWHRPEVFELLETHGAAYCVMSGAHLPCILQATASTVYIRLHGPSHEHLYAGSYSDDDLRWWADRIREWLGQGRDVFAYFNNDGHGHAVRNARHLRELLG